ncbi:MULTISPECIES: DUF397 domain-containing protein [unclassified Streptomyces]|uniref:DUF397 domain-containing protein n=1 Tax=unclassified Streptomyces TaxID=2593676 RepID=UPI0033E270B7
MEGRRLWKKLGESPLTQELTWRKSSYSGQNGGDCIECAARVTAGSAGRPGEVLVRDSKDKAGPQLAFPVAAWNSFVAAAADDEFGAV